MRICRRWIRQTCRDFKTKIRIISKVHPKPKIKDPKRVKNCADVGIHERVAANTCKFIWRAFGSCEYALI
jgi:hypothetical protein